MRLVIQRVESVSVSVNNKTVGKIGKGLFALVGIKDGDTKEDAERLAIKLSKMRIMADKKGKMNLSVRDTKTAILVVSQFTLYANAKRGNRPSFLKAGDPEKSEKIYNNFVEELRKCGVSVQTGKFGAYMKISTMLDGPVTITISNEKNSGNN